MFHVDHLDQPHCARPDLLPLVDAAFARPGGPAGQAMRTRVCPGCPARSTCLALGMSQHEDGIWGGTSPNVRTRHGAPGSFTTVSKRRVRARKDNAA